MGFWNGKSDYEEGFEQGEEARKSIEEHPILESFSIFGLAENLVMDLLASDEKRAGYHDGLDGKERR